MLKTLFVFALFLLVSIPIACTQKYCISPAPSSPATFTPTPTATVTLFSCDTPVPTAGFCQQASSLTTLHGSSTSYSYNGNPSQNYSVVSGAFPVGGSVGTANYPNQYVLQTAADWANYVASSASPSGNYPIPFNPSTQMLIILSSTALNCCSAQTIQQICMTGTQITVYVDWSGAGHGCVDNAGMGNTSYTESLGVLLPKSSLPVVWVNPCGFPPMDCMIAN